MFGERRIDRMRTKTVAAIMVTLFLTALFLTVVPVKSQPIGTLKIGVIGPVGLPHWSPAGMKEAADMARNEINAMGGIAFPEGNVTIALVFGNEYALPVPDPDAAKVEIRRMIVTEGCDIIIGGFRTEVTAAIIEEAMDHKVPFIINGAFTTELISQTVPINYARYKYLFRTNPANSTVLWRTISGFVRTLIEDKLLPLYGQNFPGMNVSQVPVAVLTEDLAWTAEMHAALTDPDIYPNHMGSHVNITYASRVPETTTDTTPYLTAVQSSGAKVLIHAFSGRAGLPLIIQWEELGIDAIPIGINVLAQIEDHWYNTLGKCEYETIVDCAGTGTPIIPGKTDAFWDNFVANTGKWPIYTAWGAYDTIYGLKDFVETTGITWADFQNSTKFADEFEDAPERVGLSGKFKFTSAHDVYCNEINSTWTQGYVRPFVVQWQSAKKEVIWPVDQVYSKELMFTWPPSQEYTLAIDSSPSGVTFTVDGLSHTTPGSETYREGSSVSLVMPETHTVGNEKYCWNQWSDGNPSRSRTVTVTADITLTAYYTGPVYQLTVISSPITGINFTINGFSKITPYTEWLLSSSYTLMMPETHNGYVWSHWLEDGDPNRIKTILLQGTTWTAVYEPAPPPVGGKASPINIPMNKPETPVLGIWLSTIILSLAVTVVYVKKRKRNTEINS